MQSFFGIKSRMDQNREQDIVLDPALLVIAEKVLCATKYQGDAVASKLIFCFAARQSKVESFDCCVLEGSMQST